MEKGHQRLYFVGQPKTLKADNTIIMLFYRSIIERFLSFGLLVWSLGDKNKDKDNLAN